MSNHYYSQGPPSSSPFYAQHHHAPSQQQQQQQQPQGPSGYGAPAAATSPVSSYSNSPPQQQPPPLRPHTAAPYGNQGYAPPTTGPPAGYYQQQQQQQPPQSQQAPGPPQSGYRPQQGRPDFSPPPQRPPQPLQPGRQDYSSSISASGFSPDLPHIIANTHGLPPEVVQRLAEDLMRSIQLNSLGSGQPVGALPQGAAPLLSHPAPPHGAPHGAPPQQGSPNVTAAAPAPPQQPQHQPHGPPRHQHGPQIPGAFPNYPGPPQQETAPGPVPPHHSHHQQRQSQSHYGPPPPQSYFPPQPTTPATATASKIPIPAQVLDDGLGRKASHRHKASGSSGYSYNPTPTTSASSSAAGKPKMTMDEGSIHYELWGELVDKEPGKEPRPREKLVSLLRDIGHYMIKERPVKESIVITPDKMVDFYTCNAIEKSEGGEELDWKHFFTGRSYSSLSLIYRALNCEHFYMPLASDQKPCIPALTPRGFETWMFTQLMSHPNREAIRLQKIVNSWAIQDTKENRRYPKLIPRRCFPDKEDQIIADGWWRVYEEFPPDFEEESEEETLALPAPGGHPYGPPRDQMTPPEGAEGFIPPPNRGKKVPMPIPIPYPDEDEDEDRRRRGPGRSKTPSERPRKPYTPEAGGSSSWREDPNPRPTLGDDMKPPTRGQAPPPRPHTSHGHHPSADEKPRSRQRDRSEYRSRRHQSRHQSRHRRASPSPDRDGDWSGSSGVSARTPGSADTPLGAPAPAPGPAGGPPGTSIAVAGSDPRGNQKRLEELARVEREQRELFRKFGNDRHAPPDAADDYEFDDEYRHLRERGGGDRGRDDRHIAEYAYQDELDRDMRRQSAGGAGGGGSSASLPGDTPSRRSHHGGSGRWEGERSYRR